MRPSGFNHNIKTKKKISQAVKEAHKRTHFNKGKKHNISQENLKKRVDNLGKRFIGKKHTTEFKRLISERLKGKSYLERYGKKKSQEIIRKYKKKRVLQIMPLKDTSIEVKIQNFLRQLGIEFLTHQYIKDIEHSYQCDIFIPSENLIIECFGDYWHKYPIGREIDNIRCQELRKIGYRIFVFWENEIKIMELIDFQRILNGVR